MFLIREGSREYENTYRAWRVVHTGVSTNGDKRGKGLALLTNHEHANPDKEIVVLPIKWAD